MNAFRMTRQLSQQNLDRETEQESAVPASRPPTIEEHSNLQSLKRSVQGCFGRQPFFKVKIDLLSMPSGCSKASTMKGQRVQLASPLLLACLCFDKRIYLEVAVGAVVPGNFCTSTHVVECSPCLQIVSVVVLWIVFLTFQQFKTRYSNCSWPYFGLFLGEVILFLIATAVGNEGHLANF